MKQMVIKIGLLVLLVSLGGCAANKVAGHWRDEVIVADGYDNEWPQAPQYYDGKRQFVIRVTSNTSTISLCLATSQADLKRQLQMAGLTIWFDPQGGEKQIFGIHLPGRDIKKAGQGPRPDNRKSRPLYGHGRSAGNETPRPMEPLDALAITYADTTGPLTMTISEVRRTGIDIGMGQPEDDRLIYEFNIAYSAAPSLSGLKPGMVVGIGILTGALMPDGLNRAFPGGPMGPVPIGGGLGGPGPSSGKRGGPGIRKLEKHFEVWLQVKLAERVSG